MCMHGCERGECESVADADEGRGSGGRSQSAVRSLCHCALIVSSGSLRIINVIDGQNKVWFGQREKSKPITKSSSCLSTLFCKHQDEQIDYWEKLKQCSLLPFSPRCHVRTRVQRHAALILPDRAASSSGRWHRTSVRICVRWSATLKLQGF